MPPIKAIKWFNTIINNNFHALTHRAYLYFIIGQVFSNMGTWMQNIALAWLTLTFTNSALMLGLIYGMYFLSSLLFSSVAGVVADSFSKRKVLIITTSTLTLSSALFAFAIIGGFINYPLILIFAFIVGAANTFDMPSRGAFAIETVGKDDCVNAVALNSAAFNLARIIGPAAAGIVMSVVGAGWCFMINAISFVPVLISLFAMKPHLNSIQTEKSPPKSFKDIISDTKDGLLYIKQQRSLMLTILLSVFLGFFTFNFHVILPLLSKQVYNFGEREFGYLMSAMGGGALTGAIVMSQIGNKVGIKRIMRNSSALLSFSLVFVGVTHGFLLTAVGAAFIGFFVVLFNTPASSILQLESDDLYRGRVMSIHSFIFAAIMPLSNFFSGLVANSIGAPMTLILCGIFSLIGIITVLSIYRSSQKVKTNI